MWFQIQIYIDLPLTPPPQKTNNNLHFKENIVLCFFTIPIKIKCLILVDSCKQQKSRIYLWMINLLYEFLSEYADMGEMGGGGQAANTPPRLFLIWGKCVR